MRQNTTIIAILMLLLSSCCSRMEYRTLSGGVWGTVYNITYRSDRDMADSIMDVMSKVEQSLSPFAEGSLVSRINRGETDSTDNMFRAVFEASVEICGRSGGMFDPTVGPIVKMWGFGDGASWREPTDAEIDSALQSVGIRECRLDGNLLKRKSPHTYFDFSSITKGYGCDLVGRMLERNGCCDYKVEIGGELALSGLNPRGEDWHIMIDAPLERDSCGTHTRMAVVAVTDCGMATSGNYRNFRDTKNGRIGHTMNPVTGRFASTGTLSATVIAPNAMLADAYATACMALPADSAIAMVNRAEGVSVMLVVGEDMRMVVSDGFPSLSR